jgi:ribonuclease HI
MTKNILQIWTDGGCRNNPGEGGIGIVLKYGDTIKKINGYVPLTTNNQMELLALIVALKNLKRNCEIDLFLDSQYVKNGITTWIKSWKLNNWKGSNKKDVKNKALWLELDSLINCHKINFNWVKGHSGNQFNEIADKLCNQAMDEKMPILNEYLHFLKD